MSLPLRKENISTVVVIRRDISFTNSRNVTGTITSGAPDNGAAGGQLTHGERVKGHTITRMHHFTASSYKQKGAPKGFHTYIFIFSSFSPDVE